MGEMPDLDMLVWETAETPLADHFSRPDCIRDSHNESSFWEARSSDPAAVAVSISADGQTLTTAAVSVADSVRVTVRSIFVNPEFPELYHEFLVRVRPRPPPPMRSAGWLPGEHMGGLAPALPAVGERGAGQPTRCGYGPGLARGFPFDPRTRIPWPEAWRRTVAVWGRDPMPVSVRSPRVAPPGFPSWASAVG